MSRPDPHTSAGTKLRFRGSPDLPSGALCEFDVVFVLILAPWPTGRVHIHAGAGKSVPYESPILSPPEMMSLVDDSPRDISVARFHAADVTG